MENVTARAGVPRKAVAVQLQRLEGDNHLVSHEAMRIGDGADAIDQFIYQVTLGQLPSEPSTWLLDYLDEDGSILGDRKVSSVQARRMCKRLGCRVCRE